MRDYKAGIYLRLSREDERLGESSSISNQRDLLLNYIRDHNINMIFHSIPSSLNCFPVVFIITLF